MEAKKRTRVVITRREHESFAVGEALITISRGLRNRSTCRIIIEAPPDMLIVRDEFLPGGRKGPGSPPPTHGGNYVDPRGDRDLDSEAA